MPSAKPLSKEKILAAMSQTLSNKAAARWMNVSYIHYKKWTNNTLNCAYFDILRSFILYLEVENMFCTNARVSSCPKI